MTAPDASGSQASDVDVARAAYQEAVDAWQEVQRRRFFPQWHFMTNVVAPAQAYITALEAENAALRTAFREYQQATYELSHYAETPYKGRMNDVVDARIRQAKALRLLDPDDDSARLFLEVMEKPYTACPDAPLPDDGLYD